jgi:hypothetical protein
MSFRRRSALLGGTLLIIRRLPLLCQSLFLPLRLFYRKNITQKELEARTGLTQQAISRFETGSGTSFRTILKYAEGVDCKLIPQSK